MGKRIALLLSGQLRTWRMVGRLLKFYFLDYYDVDVFMSVDLNNKIQSEYKNPQTQTQWDELAEAILFYRPKRIWWSNEWNFNEWRTKLGSRTHFPAYRAGHVEIALTENNEFRVAGPYWDRSTTRIVMTRETTPIYEPVFRQYHFVSQCINLMTNYVNDFQLAPYDIVFRTRFDQVFYTSPLQTCLFATLEKSHLHSSQLAYNPNPPLPLSCSLECILPVDEVSPDKIEIFVFGAGNNRGMFYVNDQFWMTNYHVATTILKKFAGEELVRLFERFETEGWFLYETWTEICWATFLVENNVSIKKSVIPDGDFVRWQPTH